jgi:hypothetical protein
MENFMDLFFQLMKHGTNTFCVYVFVQRIYIYIYIYILYIVLMYFGGFINCLFVTLAEIILYRVYLSRPHLFLDEHHSFSLSISLML